MSTTTTDGAQFTTDGLLRDACWPELLAGFKNLWRVQFTYFAAVLGIKEVCIQAVTLCIQAAGLCIPAVTMCIYLDQHI